MPTFSGRKVAVGIGLEDPNDKGKAVAPTYGAPHLDISFKDSPTSKMNESALGTIIKNNGKTDVLVEGDGSISTKLWVKGLYYWLALAFGQKPTTTGVQADATAKEHLFTLRDDNNHISATMTIKEPNLSAQFAYAMADSVTFTWTPDDFPKVEVAFKSHKSKEISGGNVTYTIDDTEFLPKHAMFKIADDLAGLDAAPEAKDIKSLTLTITKNLQPQQTMDSKDTYGEILNGEFEVSVSIEKLYRDKTYRAMSYNDERKALRLSFVDDKNKAGTKTNTSLTFDIAVAAFSGYEPSYGVSDIATEKIDAVMLLNTADFNKSITAKLVNKYTY
jgi:hypothetical protein